MTLQEQKDLLIEKINTCENQEFLELILKIIDVYSKVNNNLSNKAEVNFNEQAEQIEEWSKEVESVFGN